MVGRLLGGRQARQRPGVQHEAGPQEVNALTNEGEVMAQHHPSPSANLPRKATATAVTSLCGHDPASTGFLPSDPSLATQARLQGPYPGSAGGATRGAAGVTVGGAGLDALTGSCRSTAQPRKIAVPPSPAKRGGQTQRSRKTTGFSRLPKRPSIRARKNRANGRTPTRTDSAGSLMEYPSEFVARCGPLPSSRAPGPSRTALQVPCWRNKSW